MLDTDSHGGDRTVDLSSGHEPIGSNMAKHTIEPTNGCQQENYCRWPSQGFRFHMRVIIYIKIAFLFSNCEIKHQRWAVIVQCSITRWKVALTIQYSGVTTLYWYTRNHANRLRLTRNMSTVSWRSHWFFSCSQYSPTHCFPAPLVPNKIDFPMIVQWYI
jgi:hypothetical protein